MYVLTTNCHRQLVHEDLFIHFSRNGWWTGPFAHLFVCRVINFSLLSREKFITATVFNCFCFEITVIQSSYVATYLRMILLCLDNACIMEFPYL